MVLSVGSLLVAVLSWRASHASAREAKRSADAGERSAAAAEQSSVEAKRSSDAGERSATAAENSHIEARRSADVAERQLILSEAEAAKYVPPWRLERVKDGRCQLIHDGDEPAFDVEITGRFSIIGAPVTRGRVGPREAYEAQSYGEPDNTVIVTWTRPPEHGGGRMEWRHPLP
jgi:hypothetical protein